MLNVDTILRLTFKEEIGHEGRNSKVHKAYDPQLDTELVVKKINKTEFTREEEYFNEAQMLYASEHPNIMGVKYATQDEKHVYITMDYFKNGSLNSVIEKRFLSVYEIIKYSLEFLSGIYFMHTKKLVHLDIKPTNILISDANKAVVTDFGLSKYLNENGFADPGKTYLLHIPPETFEFGKYSYFTDIYQAGLTIYRMCNGNEFFKDQLEKLNITTNTELIEAVRKGKFPKRDAFLPHIPDKFQQIVKKAIQPDVTLRYETVLDMINAISSIEVKSNWLYNEVGNGRSYWVKENDKHKFILSLKLIEEGKWITEGKRLNKLTGKEQRINKWYTDGYSNKEEAFKSIKKLLQD